MRADGDKLPFISIIIPVMNEEENIKILADEVNNAMSSGEWSWECIWVDDCSKDNTCVELEKICKESPSNINLQHRKNYGQSAALATGFRYASGQIIVTLDGDGQNDPADIPSLIRKMEAEKADMVNGWREKGRTLLSEK